MEEKASKGEQDKITQQQILPKRGSIELRRLDRPREMVSARDSNTRPEIIYAPEKTGGCMTCLKYGLYAFNFVISLLGAAIAGVGIWLKVDPDFWTLQLDTDVKQFYAAASIAIVVGVVILIIGFIGCCGAVKESVCLLSIFFVVVLILVILEATAMGLVWATVNDKDFHEKISQKITKGRNTQDENNGLAYFMNVLQSKLKCCGVSSSDEYKIMPRSCISSETGLPYEQGCMTVLTDYMRQKAAIVGGISVLILLLQVGVLVFTICLICGIRQASKVIF